MVVIIYKEHINNIVVTSHYLLAQVIMQDVNSVNHFIDKLFFIII